MDTDELINELLTNPEAPLPRKVVNQEIDQKRSRLLALVAGGGASRYLPPGRKSITPAEVEALSEESLEQLYSAYEARLGASMVESLGQTALHLYSMVAERFLPMPPENGSKLVKDLSEDPFLHHALTTSCCEMYHRFGKFLAPITIFLTTLKHCRFELTEESLKNKRDNADERDNTRKRDGDDVE